MIITLAKSAYEFAMRHDGAEALRARVEQEIELLVMLHYDNPEEITHRVFSWNGVNNIQMGAQGPAMIVSLVEDDDGELETSFNPGGGENPDAAPVPSSFK